MRGLPVPVRQISMDDVRRRHHGHWFDPDTMRFFRSRVGEDAFLTNDGTRAYFVSSEQFKPSDGPAFRRRFTVRVIDMETGDIDTASDWQEFGSRGAARNAAIRFANSKQKEVTV
jgi:hypothetical protein